MTKRIKGEQQHGEALISGKEAEKGAKRECVGGFSVGDIVNIQHSPGGEITGGWKIDAFLPYEVYAMTYGLSQGIKAGPKDTKIAVVTKGRLLDTVTIDKLVECNPEHMKKVIDVAEDSAE